MQKKNAQFSAQCAFSRKYEAYFELQGWIVGVRPRSPSREVRGPDHEQFDLVLSEHEALASRYDVIEIRGQSFDGKSRGETRFDGKVFDRDLED